MYPEVPAGLGQSGLVPAAEQEIDVMSLKPELLDILACPACKGDLDYDRENEKLICQSWRLRFKVEDDIPNMLVDEAERF